jgi:hypothetical protein
LEAGGSELGGGLFDQPVEEVFVGVAQDVERPEGGVVGFGSP